MLKNNLNMDEILNVIEPLPTGFSDGREVCITPSRIIELKSANREGTQLFHVKIF